jgi:restriction system protein
MREFSGSLNGVQANKGVFVTTSFFTKPSREFVGRIQQTIVLIDGERLARLLMQYNVGVRIADTLLIKKVDEDFFLEA